MFIGEVAKITGLSCKAIRLYEQKGLILPPKRQGKYRIFTESDVEILHLIVQAKALGVTLSRIKGAIKYEDGNVDWQLVYQFLIDVKQQFEVEKNNLSEKIYHVERCINDINSCSIGLDSALKGKA